MSGPSFGAGALLFARNGDLGSFSSNFGQDTHSLFSTRFETEQCGFCESGDADFTHRYNELSQEQEVSATHVVSSEWIKQSLSLSFLLFLT